MRLCVCVASVQRARVERAALGLREVTSGRLVERALAGKSSSLPAALGSKKRPSIFSRLSISAPDEVERTIEES